MQDTAFFSLQDSFARASTTFPFWKRDISEQVSKEPAALRAREYCAIPAQNSERLWEKFPESVPSEPAFFLNAVEFPRIAFASSQASLPDTFVSRPQDGMYSYCLHNLLRMLHLYHKAVAAECTLCSTFSLLIIHIFLSQYGSYSAQGLFSYLPQPCRVSR